MRDDDEDEGLSKWAWITIIVAIVCFTIFITVATIVDAGSNTSIELKLW